MIPLLYQLSYSAPEGKGAYTRRRLAKSSCRQRSTSADTDSVAPRTGRARALRGPLRRGFRAPRQAQGAIRIPCARRPTPNMPAAS